MTDASIDPLGDQDDLAAGIIAGTEYSPAQIEPREFKPWHRPRKQFARRLQLADLLQRLQEERPTQEKLRYMGLPGTDLIDLRYIHDEVCRAQNRDLRFLGFTREALQGTSAQIELNLSLDEVRQLPNVDPLSRVMSDDFRVIGNPQSVAWKRVEEFGPFDVVNIDLCGGLVSDPPHNQGSIYRALNQLLTFQARHHAPWLLLVTTRIGQGMFDDEAADLLFNHFLENVENCDGFAVECNKLLESDVASINPETCSQPDYLNLMSAAIGKWLAAIVQAAVSNRVELASSLGYRVETSAECEDLVSLALRIMPEVKPSQNPFEPSKQNPVDECRTAKSILKRTHRRVDVDGVLEQDHTLLEEMINETEKLLAAARYDVTGYRDWLNQR